MEAKPPGTLGSRRLERHLDEWDNPDHFNHIAPTDLNADLKPVTIHTPNLDTLRAMLLGEIRTVSHLIGTKTTYLVALRHGHFRRVLDIEIDYALNAHAYVLLASLRTPHQVNAWTRSVSPSGAIPITVLPSYDAVATPQADATNDQITLMYDLIHEIEVETPCPWYDSRFVGS